MTSIDSRDADQKCRGALWGLYIGDALAMPVHWYYNRKALYDDYGRISDYLALKYPNDPEKALVVNTNLGGDNVYRGAVLGALLGAEKGLDRFPRRRVTGLLNPPPEMRPPAG